jgi:hypothetical protein
MTTGEFLYHWHLLEALKHCPFTGFTRMTTAHDFQQRHLLEALLKFPDKA